MDGLLEWQSATPMPDLAKRTKDLEWERKQRQREYRVAARREKRNRKADEKKQRKLNATILRRMTRNPDKYTKNAERNRLRAIEAERRTIWNESVKQAQRLAAVHDPSGGLFNVGPVVVQEDGSVVSLETLQKKEKKKTATQAEKDIDHYLQNATDGTNARNPQTTSTHGEDIVPSAVNPERVAQLGASLPGRKMSKTQQRKLAALEPRPPPPKPMIPVGIAIPDGEENWLSLWDLSDGELERRVLREKKRKAATRKALRLKQQSGKVERRAARDEKRRVYRDLKMTWKVIKEEEKRNKTKTKSAEEEEDRKIAVIIATYNRERAMEKCVEYGCTVTNTAGVEDIKPKLSGMRGQTIDLDALNFGDTMDDAELKVLAGKDTRRVNLAAAQGTEGMYIDSQIYKERESSNEFIKLDVGQGQDFEALNFNHKLRRKIRRALEAAQIRKELLVRERVKEICTERGFEPPSELSTAAKPIHERGQKVLENGQLETKKAERVRLRMELTEFNNAARVLRKQAKEIALEAGLRVYAEMTGKIPPRVQTGDPEPSKQYSSGWHIPPKANPEDFIRSQDVAILP